MKELRIVVVEPIYQVNLGYIARACKNFGVKRLNLVNPKCKYKGKEAVKYSKHARDLLESAAVFKSIAQATKGTFVVGTTALWRKTGKAFYNVYTPGKLLGLVKRNRISRVSVLIGRDNIGLTKDELAGCDATIYIPTSGEYSALNISHALVIILYSFSSYLIKSDKDMESNAADHRDIEGLSRLFKMVVSKRKDIRDKKAVTMAFNHVIKRSAPTGKELAALSAALSPRHQ